MVAVEHEGELFQLRALIDQGSQRTFISSKVQKKLKLPFEHSRFEISGMGGRVVQNSSKLCSLTLVSSKTKQRIKAHAIVLPQLTKLLPTFTMSRENWHELSSLELADPNCHIPAQIDMVIGSDLIPQILVEGLQKVCDNLLAQNTIFGWILSGSVTEKVSSFSTQIERVSNETLSTQLRQFWEQEEIHIPPQSTPENQACEDYYVATTSRNSCGRYIVRLPFKETFPEKLTLGHSRSAAFQQFLSMERTLQKKGELKTMYNDVLQEYITLGHMELTTPREINSYGNYHSFYLPHHAVVKPDKVTTKVRVVFNASKTSSSGNSLNDVLHTGPSLQPDLMLLILQWRMYRYVFNGDIEKMYRQILLHPKDTRFHRILFRESVEEELMDYELQTVTFGVNCAPYLAIRTLLQLAEDISLKYPLASKVLKQHMYVDDVLAGAHDCETAIHTRNELIEALKEAGFPLRKWTSNSKEILADVPKEHLLKEDFLQIDDLSEARMLGIRWNAIQDRFHFNVQEMYINPSYTKREVLSCVAKLFDPAGWLSPIVIEAKILMQDIWLTKIDWDDNLPRGIYLRWENFLKNYVNISKIGIPRWIRYTPWNEVEFHGFCDASEKAYAAALYVRVRERNSNIVPNVNLLVSKTKVAPVKTISLPRLELCGALLLAELISSLLPQLDVAQPVVYKWTDSTIVLSWLQKPPCCWTTFVANRVAKIEELVGSNDWNHVDSKNNPADLGSRGVSPQELAESTLWWHGPSWLKEQPSEWPQRRSDPLETELELKGVRTHAARVLDKEDILERFSDFSRALRVVARIFQFYWKIHPVHKLTNRNDSTELTAKTIRKIKTRLILLTQRRCYPEEYGELSSSNPVSAKSSIRTLNPFLDKNGVMRVGGRLALASLSYNERYPTILPYNCQFSRLLVKFSHLISLHGGNQLMLRLMRSEYWILRLKI
uniref:Peptidase A2 domain-containing protein n=1 Tax=Ceratitis capitata TaxID=7213 RepID=W8AH72_CERCA